MSSLKTKWQHCCDRLIHYAFIPDNRHNPNFVFCSGINTWNGASCRKYTWGGKKVGKNVKQLSCLLHLRCVCDHKVSLIRRSRCTLKKGSSFDPGSTTVLPQYRHRNTETDVPLAAFLTNKRLTSCTLNTAPCTSVKDYLWLSQVILVWGHLKGWREEEGFQKYPAYLYRMFKASDIARFIWIYIYIYISAERFAWNKMWRCLGW